MYSTFFGLKKFLLFTNILLSHFFEFVDRVSCIFSRDRIHVGNTVKLEILWLPIKLHIILHSLDSASAAVPIAALAGTANGAVSG